MLSIIVPTYNEAEALPLLIRRLCAAMGRAQLPFEVIVVDDNSPDGTGQVAERLASESPVRVLHRPGKLGLASAVLDAIPLARGELIGVMDADLSHPPEAVPDMVRAMERTGAGLVVGSRYVHGGGMEDWPLQRQLVSMAANLMTRWLTPVKDATSGFFILRRESIEGIRLNPLGFKIGLEVFARAKVEGFVEVPYMFTDRKHGSSKFGSREVWYFLKQLALLYVELRGKKRPRRLA